MKKYPEVLYAHWEEEGTEDEYLSTDPDVGFHAEIGESRKVAHYVLREVLTVTSEVITTVTK